MKNILIIFIALFCTVSICAQNKRDTNSSKKLVAYFSCTGTTKAAAQKIANATGATLYEITPAKAYTSEDLDWRNKKSRSSIEMQDPKSRPAISGKIANINKYDVIFIGYPIWWNLAPRIINTFFESNNLKGKKVVLFATSGSSSIDNSQKTLQSTYKDLDWAPGKLLNGTIDKKTITDWTSKIKK